MSLIGMNAGLMEEYIEFCADRLLTALGHSKVDIESSGREYWW